MSNLLRGKYQPLILLVLMVAVGNATASVEKIALLVGLWLFGYGWIQTVKKRNVNGEAHLYAGFIVGAEVYFRMSYAGLPWEFGKLAVIILLVTGMLVERQKRSVPITYVIYLLLLIPAVFVPDWQDFQHFKNEFMFTFFGQLVLVVSIFYFFRRKLDRYDLVKFGRWIVLGVVLTSVLLYLKTPDYSSITYGGGANFAASGGFGPNQVAAILGLGMMLMGYFLLINQRVFVYKFIDIFVLFVFTMQGFFTFSRGGLMAAGLALFLGVFSVYFYNYKNAKKLLRLNPLKIMVLSLLVVFTFIQVDSITGGALEKRYFNVDEYGNQIKEDYSTKRLSIVDDDIYTFLNHIETGAGIGGSRAYRELSTGISAAHVEFSRMLAEHGILGVLALIIMFVYPIYKFFKIKDTVTQFVLVIFVAYGLLTMSHNALRLALPSFLYGMGFIWIIVQGKTLKSNQLKVEK